MSTYTLQRAIHLVTAATEKEKRKNYEEALRLYELGVQVFLLAIKNGALSGSEKDSIREKILQNRKRAENLKTYIRDKSGKSKKSEKDFDGGKKEQEENHINSVREEYHEKKKLINQLKGSSTDDGSIHVHKSISNQSVNGLKTLSQNLKDFLFQGRYGDVRIIVGGWEFMSHKFILAARSPVFDRMFQTDMVETQSGIVNITDFDPLTFQYFLIFLYAGEVDFESCGNVIELYKAADKYYVKELKEGCSAFMERSLSIDTICDVIPFSALYNEHKLLETSTQYFIDNADKILLTEKWMVLSKANHALANKLVGKAITRKSVRP